VPQKKATRLFPAKSFIGWAGSKDEGSSGRDECAGKLGIRRGKTLI